MRITAKLIPVGRGAYGPFNDGRTIAYVDLASEDGGDVVRATQAQHATTSVEQLELFKPINAALELVSQDNKLKLRFLGLADAKPVSAAA